MDMFGFNNMSEDEFRKEFLKFLNMYQSGMDNFMKKHYGTPKNTDPFYFGIEPLDYETLRKMLGDVSENININKGEDDKGEWETKSWTSPDGSSSFSSFSRNSYFNPFDGKVRFKKEEQEIDTVKLLSKKLNQAIMDEKYEDAAKIRDLIKSLQEDKK
jgi:hypothetical protein